MLIKPSEHSQHRRKSLHPFRLPPTYHPPQRRILLFFLFVRAASRRRDFRLECSWLDDSTGLDWSRLPFVDVLVMALELVLACEAIAAAVLAPRLGARKTLFVRAGAMGGLAVASRGHQSFW